MKIVLVGYGRMGKEIERIAINRGHQVICRVDALEGVGDVQKVNAEVLKEADAVIEFALPNDMDNNIKAYAESKVPVVIGTTGWTEKREAYRKLINDHNGTLIYGSNYSVGAHILFKLAENAAAMVNKIEDYDIMINEFHHKNKKDSPSGTALTLGERVLANCDRKTVLQTEQLNRAIRPEELHIAAVRGGSIPGVHTLTLDSDADTIEITHTARNRGGFALGSVLAAEWLVNQKPGFYPVETFMDSLLKTTK